jgi:hypothetical protein
LFLKGTDAMRFIGLLKADKSSEAGDPPSPELLARMGPFIEEVMKAGVVTQTEGLFPSSRATRIRLANGKTQVTDGPFAETKELVASYAMFEVKSKDEAVEWTKRFLQVLGEGECMIYQIQDHGDCGGEPC